MFRLNIYSLKQIKEKGALYNLRTKTIRSPQDAYEAVEEVLKLSEEPKENFGILSLNTKNDIIGVHVIHIGSLNASIVHPREVFTAAMLNNAASLIAFHNHPSGNPAPSQEDIHVTKRLVDGGKILGIEVLDHIITGDNTFVSLKEKGYI